MTKEPNPLTNSRKVQETGPMRSIQMPSSALASRFRLRFGLAHHRRACSSGHRGPKLTPWRFSTRFGYLGRCANLRQHVCHDPTHLPRRHPLAPAFPGTIGGLAKHPSQNQLVHRAGHHQTPALKLLWGTHMYLRPQQVLFEKAIAVFVGEAPSIARCHLGQRQFLFPHPNKPAFARIALAPARLFPQDTNHHHLHVPRLSEVYPFPSLHHQWFATPIAPLPRRVWFSPGLGTIALKELPIFAGGPTFSWRMRGSRSIELAIAFEADQGPQVQPLACLHERTGRIPAVGQQSRRRRQQRAHPFQLLDPHRDRSLRCADPTLREDATPTTGLLWQEHHARELPAHTHRFGGVRQIGHVDHPAIRARFGFGPGNAGAINADPHGSIVFLYQGICPDGRPPLLIDLAIYQCLVDTGPVPSEERRERQFRQRAGRALTAQRITQLKERIGAAFSALIHLMTNVLQCVKVHRVRVLCFHWFDAKNLTLFGSFWQPKAAFWFD